MRTTCKVVASVALVFAVVLATQADDKPEKDKTVTLKGELGCGKCVFKAAKGGCVNAIKVKDTIYFIDDGGRSADYHKEICMKKVKGQVTGKVFTKDGKKWIKPEKDGVKLEE
jgi:hypothetical protein